MAAQLDALVSGMLNYVGSKETIRLTPAGMACAAVKMMSMKVVLEVKVEFWETEVEGYLGGSMEGMGAPKVSLTRAVMS